MVKEKFKLPDGKEISVSREVFAGEIESKLFPFSSMARLLATDNTYEQVNRGAMGEVIEALFEKVHSDTMDKFKEVENCTGQIFLVYARDRHENIRPGDLLDVQFGNSDERKPKKIGGPDIGETTPDFRTVAPESRDELHLQRAFDVLNEGGMNRDLLIKYIDDAWTRTIMDLKVEEAGRA